MPAQRVKLCITCYYENEDGSTPTYTQLHNITECLEAAAHHLWQEGLLSPDIGPPIGRWDVEVIE